MLLSLDRKPLILSGVYSMPGLKFSQTVDFSVRCKLLTQVYGLISLHQKPA